ncbi:MAG: Gfo/Idh/MocA family oxidoreductase [Verrucomicrobiota bacterium]
MNLKSKSTNQGINRRQFIAGAGTAAVGLTILNPQLAFGDAANRKLNLGLIGCGGRGQWILKFFADHGGFNLVACADYFQDKVDAAGEKYGIPATKRFTGLLGYKRLLEQKLDGVVIESPPYFHPEHAAAAVDAGKHVYCAKPVAVDVPGCRTIESSGKIATKNNLCLLVDFQLRAHPSHQEAVKRVHAGMIGQLVSMDCCYQTGLVFASQDAELRKNPKNPELRLRAWGSDRTLSGDVITEQNIHALDLASWYLDASPLRAYGTGGRKRDYVGNCWDHFAVIYYFPNDIVVSFSSKQVGHGYDDIMCRVYGLEGTAEAHYFGDVIVRTKDDIYNGGKTPNLYAEGVTYNVATFYDSITKGDFSNPTVAPSVRSNLTTILGRTAAYKRTEVTWDKMLRANEKWTADLKGLKA